MRRQVWRRIRITKRRATSCKTPTIKRLWCTNWQWIVRWSNTGIQVNRGREKGHMSTAKRFGGVVAVAVACMTTLASAQIKKDFKYALGQQASVTINNEYGPIFVKPSANNELLVTAILQSDKVEIDETRNADRVLLKTHLLPGATAANRSVEYQVQVPANANVT